MQDSDSFAEVFFSFSPTHQLQLLVAGFPCLFQCVWEGGGILVKYFFLCLVGFGIVIQFEILPSLFVVKTVLACVHRWFRFCYPQLSVLVLSHRFF